MAISDYNANTNWINEERYLNGLIAQGGGNAEWARHQLDDLHAARDMYSSASGSSGSSGSLPSFTAASIPTDIVGYMPQLGDIQNYIDQITAMSDKASAQSLEMAQQQQAWSAEQAQIANQFSAQEAQKNRDWQQMMSNTAHQREVADLKAAGLNPVLSATGGQGSPVTSGATAQSHLPSGASGKADSATGAMVSLMGSLLSAQTSIVNQAMSARTQEAIAEKNNAMAMLIAQLQSSTSKYGYDLNASTSRYNAELGAAASKYGSWLSSEALKYGYDMNYQIRQDFPNNLLQILNSVLSENGSSYSKVIRGLLDMFHISPSDLGLSRSFGAPFGSDGRKGSFGGR